jgi:putative Mg2+ transporter-C (MgtC) family protein
MDWEPLWRMLFAALLSVPIGLDREFRGKSAGLRTHVVVATASAALGYVSVAVSMGDSGTDAGRIAAQVVSGIGFMGAGVIFATGGRVHGLTTAAALWAASAIGLCVGLSADALAVATTVVIFVVLWPLDWATGRVFARTALQERSFFLVAEELAGLTRVQQILTDEQAAVEDFTVEPFGEAVSARIVARCREDTARALLQRFRDVHGVRFATDQALLTVPPG